MRWEPNYWKYLWHRNGGLIIWAVLTVIIAALGQWKVEL